MEQSILERAIKLKKEIRELDMMVFYMNCTWGVKLTMKTPKLLLKNIAYGAFESHEIECDKELGDRIKKLVEEYKAEKEKKFLELG